MAAMTMTRRLRGVIRHLCSSSSSVKDQFFAGLRPIHDSILAKEKKKEENDHVKTGSSSLKDLRDFLNLRMEMEDHQRLKKKMQGLDRFDETPSFALSPSKEHVADKTTGKENIHSRTHHDPNATKTSADSTDSWNGKITKVRSKTVEDVVNHANLIQSGIGEAQQVSTLPTPTERSSEQCVEQLNSVQAADAKNLAETLSTRKPNDGTSTDLCYESLNFEAQKKNEELMKNNLELVRKLEFALGKIEAYEKMMVAKGPPRRRTIV